MNGERPNAGQAPAYFDRPKDPLIEEMDALLEELGPDTSDAAALEVVDVPATQRPRIWLSPEAITRAIEESAGEGV